MVFAVVAMFGVIVFLVLVIEIFLIITGQKKG